MPFSFSFCLFLFLFFLSFSLLYVWFAITEADSCCVVAVVPFLLLLCCVLCCVLWGCVCFCLGGYPLPVFRFCHPFHLPSAFCLLPSFFFLLPSAHVCVCVCVCGIIFVLVLLLVLCDCFGVTGLACVCDWTHWWLWGWCTVPCAFVCFVWPVGVCVQPFQQPDWRCRSSSACRGAEEQQHSAHA